MMYPIWKVRKQNFDPDELHDLGCGRLVGAVLSCRFESPEKAYEFVTMQRRVPPFAISGMRDAINRTLSHVVRGSTILVSGDYDTDGICATAIVYRCLKEIGANVHWFLPVRSDGYGFGMRAVEKAREIGARLIIALDTGTNDIEACRTASKMCDVVVIDHHRPLNGRPPVQAFVNPHYYQDPDDYYCAAGLALKFAEGISMIRDIELKPDLYVIAAVATVADVMPLVGENRYIVSKGIELWPYTTSAGLKALRHTAGINKASTFVFGYTVGPRLNAPGRVGDPSCALELLLTDDEELANRLAWEIEQLNALRQKMTEEAESIAREIISKAAPSRALIVADERIHDGIAGIVAGRLARHFNMPAIVMTKKDGVLRGSGRAPDGYDLVNILKSVDTYLTAYGGHKSAAGVTMQPEEYENFARALDELLPPPAPPFCEVDVRLDLVAAPPVEEVAELSLLEPFGTGNPVPLFLAKNVKPQNASLTSDGKHVRFKVGNTWMIWFNGAQAWDKLGDTIDIAFEYDINIYNDASYVQGVIRAASPGVSLTRESMVFAYISIAQGDYEGLESLGLAKHPALHALLELGVISTEKGKPAIVPVEGKRDLSESSIYTAYMS